MAAGAQRLRAHRGGRCAEVRQGRGPRARRRQGEGPAARRAARPQGHVLLQGQARRMRLEDPQRLDRARDRDRGGAAGSRRLVPARRRSHGRSSPTGRPGTTSTSATSAIRGAPDCITGGSSSGSGSAVAARLRAGRARLRHRRLDPHAGAFLRRDRLQADQQPRQPRQRDAALVHARHGRAAGADRRGLRDRSCRSSPGPIRSIRRPPAAPEWDANAMQAPREGPAPSACRRASMSTISNRTSPRRSTTRSRPSRSSASRSCRSICRTR